MTTGQPLKVIDPLNVQETFAGGLVMVHACGPGLIEITFTTARHDPQAIVESRQGEPPSFVVVSRIILPERDATQLAEQIRSIIAGDRARRSQMPPSGTGDTSH
jgi:hypothetical protein